MKIQKIYNNNLASILDEKDNEVIIMGKGIAFGKKAGSEIDESKIDKRFYLANPVWNDKFRQLFDDIPADQIEFMSNAIEFAKTALNKELSDSIYVSLTDHVHMAIERARQNLPIKNPMLWEIKRYYEPEFEVGTKIIEMITETYGVALPEDEAGFIAIHLVEAGMDDSTIDHAYEVVNIIQDVSNIVRYYFKIEFDPESVYYYRFITHIRFFAQRLVLNKMNEDGNDENELFDIIKTKYTNAYGCVQKIEEYVNKSFGHELTQDEQLYLMIHIERVVYKTK